MKWDVFLTYLAFHIKLPLSKVLTCCVEAAHAVNAVLEYPGKQT